MKILMINKFLYPKGGAETYMLRLGAYLEDRGHSVQYFGMAHPENTVGNRMGAYTRSMDFHGAPPWEKLTYPIRTVYSREARKQLRRVLEDFRPDVCHLNNFHYQLTPGILLEIRSWSRKRGRPCRIVATAHDFQLVCPNHMCHDPGKGINCGQCLGGHFGNCIRNRCIHGSLPKSLVGAVEAALWNRAGVYRQLDTVICCSQFLKDKLDTNPVLAEKTVLLRNYIEEREAGGAEKKDYVLCFGRCSREKGIETLVQAAKLLPRIPFVVAGAGPLEDLLADLPNIKHVGFQTGEALKKLIREARFSVCPSLVYENCPFSLLESMALGTPVLGARIGGIPELIRPGENGELFESGNAGDLAEKIAGLYEDEALLSRYAEGCRQREMLTLPQYAARLEAYYRCD